MGYNVGERFLPEALTSYNSGYPTEAYTDNEKWKHISAVWAKLLFK